MQEHEYALIGGFNRAKIGRYLTLTSTVVSGGIVFTLLSAVNLANFYHIPVTLPPVVLSLVSATCVFAALYWIFDRFLWKMSGVASLLKVPNLAGEWRCEGQTLDGARNPTYQWQGTVTIVQSWDRIRLHLKTATSGSDSVAAALMSDAIDGYHLLYHYKNTPGIQSAGLAGHRGFAELIFAHDLRSAYGEYFNGGGRFTFGTLKLTRI